MKNYFKTTIVTLLVVFVTNLQAQKKSSESSVSMVLDLQPVLQLDFESPEEIAFVFNKKGDYVNGIKKEKVTKIRVTSSVKWDLYAVGRSTGNNPNGNTFWNQEVSFESTQNSVANLPMSLLEIKQSSKNKNVKNIHAEYVDYSQNFANQFRSSAGNSLYVAANGTPTPPSNRGKYIAGHNGASDDIANGYMHPGSYISNKNFEFKIDYRILPGYPAIFPNAFNEDATVAENIVATANSNTVLAGGSVNNSKKSYAEAGVYSMTVQYVLLEDQ